MRLSFTAPLLLTTASLALAACGDSSKDASKDASTTEASTAPAVALREAGETRAALQAALATYKAGDQAKAEEQVAEAYVQHFEEVEHSLEERDHELKARLEEAIGTDLRNEMKAKKPVAEVESSVNGVVADLTKAEALLR
jgi:hypothetical protein